MSSSASSYPKEARQDHALRVFSMNPRGSYWHVRVSLLRQYCDGTDEATTIRIEIEVVRDGPEWRDMDDI